MGVDKLALSGKSGNKHPRIVELFQPAVERRFVYRHQPLCSSVQSLVGQTDVALKGFSLAIRVFKTALKSRQLLLQCRRFGTRLVALVSAAALAGCAVSFAGLIGFVGLIVPHAVRTLVGHDNRRVLAMAPLLGGLLVCLCDLLARTLFSPYEIPVGIVLSLLGGPFFVYLILRRGKGGLNG